MLSYKYIVVFAFTYVLANLTLLYGNFGLNTYNGNNNVPMRQDDEAVNASSLHFSEALNASSLHHFDFSLFV